MSLNATPSPPRPAADNGKAIPLAIALIPVVSLVALLILSLRVFGADPHIPLILSTAIAATTALLHGTLWEVVEAGLIKGVRIAVKPCLILMVVGMLIGVWIASGCVPLLIDYGLQILAPSSFLAAACLISAVISLATGSSWSTAGTIGIALIGVAQGLGIPPGMAAGAIVSGAYFGDKMSPLSDTTNLAPAVAGTELFTHIRHMVYTTAPAFAISVLLFFVLGFSLEQTGSTGNSVAVVRESLAANFNLNPILLLAPASVLFLVIRKVSALPALLLGTLVGGCLGAALGQIDFGTFLNSAQYGFSIESGNTAVDELLSRGGMQNMMWTVSLVISAMAFGGVMEATGMLQAIAASILTLARSTGSLIASVIATAFGMNALASDQYLAIVIPGRMFKDAFHERGLAPKNLSRALEDAGTVTSPLIPWNSCGAYMAGALTVATLDFVPYAFFNLLCPLISLVYGFTGITITRVSTPKPTHNP